ncbi:hypothetical protein IAI53_07660 [Thauera sp. CAU 1555]|uniref:Uncharacterized protein n=1 Tax=Thauera sedimentorum TaxID=2767595 RepID=A0ABR9BC08_9RHOO|nr:hypothetical protein [Thauera sedimentorum]MBC9071842.1 hypothetical protein [Thauera sedimentorum]MBD8502761.1 hypothetical protein [Thauera sedimentorum]
MSSTNLPELRLTEDERKVLALLDAAPPSFARHCFRSAIEHLRRALLIQDLDPAMAMFRGITAEEEAASGLMRALLAKHYPNAHFLNPRDHVQKQAVTPFLRILLHHMAEFKFDGVRRIGLAIKKVDGVDRLVVGILLDGDAEQLVAAPVPPLEFQLREGEGEGFPDLSRSIQMLLQSTGYSDTLRFLKAEANLRNRILYAGEKGYPRVSTLNHEFLADRQRRVFMILKTALLILPYDQVQSFAADALERFLRLVNRISEAAKPRSGEVVSE